MKINVYILRDRKKKVGVINAQRMQLINERKKSLWTNFSLGR